MLDFGRELCSDASFSGSREWLVTNGIGGYASGTIAGVLSRSYHGLLVAALEPPVGRMLLVAKLDDSATTHGTLYPLSANRWSSDKRSVGSLEPEHFSHLERFYLEGTTPVWAFACADALLEKRVWMEHGANTTYVRYDLKRGSGPLALNIKAIVNYRDHHGTTAGADWRMRVEPVAHGLRVTARDDAVPFCLLSDRAKAMPRHEWYRGYALRVEAYRGLDDLDDNLYAGDFWATLEPGESLTLVASTDPEPNLDGFSACADRRDYEERLLNVALPLFSSAGVAVEHLVLAADQFVVHRALPNDVLDDGDGRSIIAGYHWFGDWGRDTMISLPGLALATGRHELAARILTTFAHFMDEGMLPNRFPDVGQEPEYNTVDATLWYFEAIRATYEATGDETLLGELYPVLQEIVRWHRRGTRYGIHVDSSDGLLYAGEEGVQLTWMDAKVGDWVVTPRIGKPVEISALWYNALRIMVEFSHRLGVAPEPYDELANLAGASFSRYWNSEVGYCYDVIDGPGGDEPALRPNQLFAVCLPHSPLTEGQQRAVVDACAKHLLTSHGLRSLAPFEPGYTGQYGGGRRQRDAAYHQGTVWGWLLGPFARAHLRVYRDPETAQSFLYPLCQHLAGHGVGSVSEIFDGDAPFTPRGCIAQAWSVAELLQAWQVIGAMDAEGKEAGEG